MYTSTTLTAQNILGSGNNTSKTDVAPSCYKWIGMDGMDGRAPYKIKGDTIVKAIVLCTKYNCLHKKQISPVDLFKQYTFLVFALNCVFSHDNVLMIRTDVC